MKVKVSLKNHLVCVLEEVVLEPFWVVINVESIIVVVFMLTVTMMVLKHKVVGVDVEAILLVV